MIVNDPTNTKETTMTAQMDKVSDTLRSLTKQGYIKKEKCDIMLWEIASGNLLPAKMMLVRMLEKFPSAREEILCGIKRTGRSS